MAALCRVLSLNFSQKKCKKKSKSISDLHNCWESDSIGCERLHILVTACSFVVMNVFRALKVELEALRHRRGRIAHSAVCWPKIKLLSAFFRIHWKLCISLDLGHWYYKTFSLFARKDFDKSSDGSGNGAMRKILRTARGLIEQKRLQMRILTHLELKLRSTSCSHSQLIFICSSLLLLQLSRLDSRFALFKDEKIILALTRWFQGIKSLT